MPGATVLCYSGYTYAQEPRTVFWEGRRCEVERVVHRWRTQAGPAFRIVVEEGEIFDLRYIEAQDDWEILLLDEQELPSSSILGETGSYADGHHV